ncbi:ATP-binding protein [Actinoplanes friuliensis]|uniref:histidine kinase n=1 Tax=Actinoplanes friuliensis DSM 7358 TaxID=1246995 RepID=U5VUB6_9ACTN|nr:ATP-binding protein [Actinoplanes friuliensis]AGZ40543.1 ATP-binding region ATPase domain-containing protein [Actinoplanes friuliensis DSM 7358]
MPHIPPSAVPATDDVALRGRLTWLIAAPAGAAALLFAVTAGYFWAGGADTSDLVLVVAFLLGVLALVVVAAKAAGTVRQLDDRVAPLLSEAATARAEAATARAEADAARTGLADAQTRAASAKDEATGARTALDDARAELTRLAEQLQVAEQRPVPVRTSAGRQVEVFVNLSRRLQSLVHREIKLLDALENEVEDPDLLKGLFQVDHLATRIRRHAENLAVLGGAVSRRQWSRPVALTEVLRSAIAEVEHYSRVKLVPPIEGTVPGHAVASIIHLVAELIENATMFAPPHTQVLLRAQHVAAGVAVEVEDRGLGMQRDDQERVNRLLLNPDDINLDELLADGRIGLFVVSMIARQHGVTVQLQGNIYGGTQAVVILPQHLLGSAQADPEPTGTRLALSQNTMELAQRIPGPSQIAAAPPVWPAFAPPAEVPEPVAVTTPPPLPRRHSQTHLAPELQAGPPAAAPDDDTEHNTGLMASFMQGVSRSEAADQPDENR